MISLRTLLARKDRLLSLLEESATNAHQSVLELAKTCKNPSLLCSAEDLRFSRVVERKLTEEICGELHSTSTSAVHGEELEDLAEALYKIPKIANKFHERLVVAPNLVREADFSGQLSLLEEATGLLVGLIKSFQSRLDLEQAKAAYERLQSIEQEGDRRLLARYKDLYGGRYPAEQAFLLKDLFELLEKLLDRTKRAGRLAFVLIRSNC